ncbi:MAG TPA: Gfo/Idh/MocA family oxidoreductase [Tepidisphaeraceae bacterium]|jgi:predicted dehydrogenase|nr:Gfo/Idh/MocA family oxidoreductase [Tepidisphaeraceae bacterium]
MLPFRLDDSSPERVSFAILGCGSRGQMFADWIARHPERAGVVAVAEPNAERRDLVANRHGVPVQRRFASWEELLAQPRLADALVDALMDREHAASAISAIRAGYHVMLEKPMAVSLEQCVAIDSARRECGRIVSVCHSLRYHAVYREVRRLIAEGAIGECVSIDQLEGVEPVHQSHSFIRGNWGNESRSTFMLLAKSCHDIDILIHLMGRDCTHVSSFGELSHFNAANRPAGAPDRCIDGCPHDSDCPYSANKIYRAGKSWGEYLGMGRLSQPQRDQMLRTSRWGLCVYNCDNDAVDHQVVNFQFAGGATGTFTMTAFAPGGRHLRVHGTRGYLTADIERRRIDLHRFWGIAPSSQTIEFPPERGGHGGGDDQAMECLVTAIHQRDPASVLTGTAESLRTHTVVFAAERARRERRVVEVDAMPR